MRHENAIAGIGIRTDGQRRSRRVQHSFDDLTVVDLAAGDCKVQRTAFAVDNGVVDFRGPAAAADACLRRDERLNRLYAVV